MPEFLLIRSKRECLSFHYAERAKRRDSGVFISLFFVLVALLDLSSIPAPDHYHACSPGGIGNGHIFITQQPIASRYRLATLAGPTSKYLQNPNHEGVLSSNIH